MSDNLAYAVKYAQRGYPVFPVLPRGKVPLTQRGFHDASVRGQDLQRWWTNNPEANIGISTGPAGLVVIDIDGRHGGFESLAELVREHGPLDTAIVTTGGGGEHLYFRRPKGCRIPSKANAFGARYPGIDVRSDGGYVVAPPSIHSSGQPYAWGADNPSQMAELPLWAAALLVESQTEKRKIEGADTGEPIRSGARRESLLRWAGRLRRLGTSEQAILDALNAMNARDCVPPLPDDEVRRIAREAGKWAPQEPYAIRPAQPESQEAAFGPGLKFITADEVETVQLDWLWQDRMPKGSLVALIGEPSVGKTYLYCAIASALSNGHALPGGQPYSCRSLIYAGEDTKGQIKQRLQACGADLKRITLVDGDLSREAIPALDEWLEENPDVGFVVIDPVAVVLGGKDENRDGEVRECLIPLASLAERRGVVIMFLRHLSKDTTKPPMQRILGSGAFGAVPRSVLYLSEHKTTKRRAIFHEKSNWGEKAAPVEYAIGDGFMWLDENEELDADGFSRSVVPLDSEERKRATKLPDAIKWVEEFLRDGPFPSHELMRLGQQEGFSDKTLRRARDAAGVQSAQMARIWYSFLWRETPGHVTGHLTKTRENTGSDTQKHTHMDKTFYEYARAQGSDDLLGYAEGKL